MRGEKWRQGFDVVAVLQNISVSLGRAHAILCLAASE